MWLAMVREPRSWFYSAVGFTCIKGPQNSVCHSNATMDTLLDANWFQRPQHPPPSQTYGRGTAKYFHSANFQARMLGDIVLEDSWAICTLQNSKQMFSLVSLILKQPVPEKHENVHHWPGIDEFKTSIPWESVQPYYLLDEALYASVAKFGCLMHAES